MNLLKTIKTNLSPYKRELIFGPILKLIEAMIEVSLPILIATTIDQLTSITTKHLFIRGLLFLFLIIVGLFCAMIAQLYAAKASQGFGTNLRNHLFKHILSLSNSQIEQFGSSSFVNRITTDVTNLEVGVAMLIRLVIRVPFICIGSFIMVWILNKQLAITLLASVILLSICIYLIMQCASRLHRKANQKLDVLALSIKENLMNIRLIRSFVSQVKETKKFQKKNQEFFSFSRAANLISGLLNPMSIFILDIAILFILYLSNFRIANDTLSQGSLIAIINYISQILLAVIVLSNLVAIYAKCFASIRRIQEVFAMKSKIIGGNLTEFSSSPAAIELKNVCFSYNASIPFLSHINLTIKKGEIIGIVGLTGSGKTTFLNLLNRSIDITSGILTLFGKEIQEYHLDFLRTQVRFIEQKPKFLTSSIQENVSLSSSISEKELHNALLQSESLEFVNSLKNKEKTLLENNASNLSGGQKQRISLARAFVRNS